MPGSRRLFCPANLRTMNRGFFLLVLLALAGAVGASRHQAFSGRPTSSLYLLVRNFGPTFCAHQRVRGGHCSRATL